MDIPLRVTYYARVSSESDEQLNSLGNQVAYYNDLIKENTNGTKTVVYTGTSRGAYLPLGDIQRSAMRVMTMLMNSAAMNPPKNDTERGERNDEKPSRN